MDPHDQVIQRFNAQIEESVSQIIGSSHVVIFSMDGCRFCDKAKAFLQEHNIKAREVVLDPESDGMALYEDLQKVVNKTSVPQIFVGGKSIGGCDDMHALHDQGKLMSLIRGHDFEYDLIVVGGGSGGLAASKEAASFGKKVALLDFVTPSNRGTTWGLGGTCVNVGCIPKKLMHQASLIGGELEDSQIFGWKTKDGQEIKNVMKHDWNAMVENVQNNVKSSNFGYRNELRSNKVNYINAYGKLLDPHTIEITHKNGKVEKITADKFLIATGERPRVPEVKGAKEHAITSDDIFSLNHAPGKTLVVGASYVALECAGFLRGFGYDVTVAVRSIVLRGFDRQCSEIVKNFMAKADNVKFLETTVPINIERLDKGESLENAQLKVTFENATTKEKTTEVFNTVMFAAGRLPCTKNIGLETVGVKMDKEGYVHVTNEQTSVPNIYALGDIIVGHLKLTPVAIEAGILLARRLYGDSDYQCDYTNVPTTVFTPIEYGCVGLTEEQANEEHGEQMVEVYHQYFTPTEWRINYYDRPRKPLNYCYAKAICVFSYNRASFDRLAPEHFQTLDSKNPKNEKLVGFHYVGPNAGEVIQFAGLALKAGMTKYQLDRLIGIHPTNAEIFTSMKITKRSGLDPTQKGCCG